MTDIANTEQAEYWNGSEGGHWAENQDRYDTMLESFGTIVLDAAEIGTAERVLDVGCGCGATTIGAARRAPQGSATGADLSGPMLARGRERAAAEGTTNVEFVQADAQVHDFGAGTYDVVLSRFGVMFFADPVAAFANLARALRSGGRLAFVCWQDLFANEWMWVPGAAAASVVGMPEAAESGAPGPFAFADLDRVRGILDASGFVDVACEAATGRLLLGGGGGVDDAVAFLRETGMARALFAEAAPADVERAITAVRDALEPYATPDGVSLGGATWVVTARRP